jgi:ribosome-binding factor A
MPREFSRSDRVASEIQKEMADLIRTHVRDPGLGLVTVSEAEVSRDLAVAKIYVSFLGNTLDLPECMKRLAQRTPELRRELGRRIRIRVLPEIRFLHDDSIETGMRMDALLEGLSHPDGPRDENDS